MILDYAYWITQALLGLAVLGAVYRVYRGPSVLDRVISVDVILIVVGSMLLADMAYHEHQDFILFVVVTAVIGFLGAVAIARYVVVRVPEPDHPETVEVPEVEPAAPGQRGSGQGRGAEEDETTSWFAALTKSGFTPKKKDDQAGES
ncbi:monovalent cation/H+ antiporter complex subunit F [Nesterenkonia alba]|uniref:monovalent cation/H+ antiporter complex subunit F n=1 Tax=Nesterenkonia alba TaxID=515814 RepID=UPI0003B38B9C|nr:monovalent cation/H+ antiporter complex subunit F [Nesterenkonia alba]